jgi:hypothetical protein
MTLKMNGHCHASAVVRQAKAQTRRDLASGELTLAELLNDPPAYYANVPTFKVLMSLPRFGPKTLAKWNSEAVRGQMNLALPPARLSTRTRDWLIARNAQRNGVNVGRIA